MLLVSLTCEHPMTRRAVLAAILLVTSSQVGSAQLRRSADGAAPPAGLPSIARNPRFPFAGTWVGRRNIEANAMPVAFAINADNERYSSVMILPDNARVPLERTRLVGDTLVWESPNSGGGMWVYKAHRLAGDTLVGTILLRDAPANFGPKPPSGKFSVVRQPAGAGGL
jgi:hypothetical protein